MPCWTKMSVLTPLAVLPFLVGFFILVTGALGDVTYDAVTILFASGLILVGVAQIRNRAPSKV